MNLDTGKNLEQVKSLYNTNTLGKNKLRTFFDKVFDKVSIRLDNFLSVLMYRLQVYGEYVLKLRRKLFFYFLEHSLKQ